MFEKDRWREILKVGDKSILWTTCYICMKLGRYYKADRSKTVKMEIDTGEVVDVHSYHLDPSFYD